MTNDKILTGKELSKTAMDSLENILSHPYWRHRIDLGDGNYTPGPVDASKWCALGLPEDCSGLSVLDVGAFDGLLSFEAERRGADYVLATDIWGEPDYDEKWWESLRPGKHGFNLAHDYLDSDVESNTIAIEDLSTETVGTFDLVICSGVIYHLKEPLSALENLVDITEDIVVVDTALASHSNRPVLEIYPGSELAGNPTNWFAPTLPGLQALMEAAGFQDVEVTYRPVHETKAPVRPAGFGYVTADTQTYTDPNLDEGFSHISAGTPVSTLYWLDNAIRIEWQDGKIKRQGWVVADSVHEPSDSVADRLIETVRYEGIHSTVKKVSDKLRKRSERGVAHAKA